MDHAILAKRVKEVAYLEVDFLRRSGKRSNFYLDKYLFETQPDILAGHATGVSALLNMSKTTAGSPVLEGGDPTDLGGGDSTPSPDAIDASV